MVRYCRFFLAFSVRFPVRFEVPMCSDALIRNMLGRFSLISNLVVTTYITVVSFRDGFLLKSILESKQVASCAIEFKNNAKFTKQNIFLNSKSQQFSKIK